ncbi:MAG TPA: chemotaxis protein CheX [Spirochaetota bacterium]|jgi:chemotaxis protein CheX|nr:MAG: CheY-P phosphatase CheX [Spirochaetes bacterium ADurb.Bin133]HOF02302.1 chemotaxis protein CheX [Spirochaetota bacterium]HOS33839.1 chemotaxis protein CheX [Spirochaetota bacterium]HPK61842.1 chemotaxis protein CheX [Spirochaetota bacterium]HQB60867.1 chemotaxis protein CheX [Spirochaetota bacterium]
MRVEYINPFVDSAMQILSSTVSKDLKRRDISLKPSLTPMMGVVIIVGLAGQVSGRLIIDTDKDTALKIASAMNQEELKEFDEMTYATLTELANMITGKAVTKLHELGFQFDLTPPALFTGDNIQISDNKIESLVVPIEMPQGRVEIIVGIKEN